MTVSEFPYWGHFRSFKIKNGYLCGVCRRSYVDEVQAKTCVINCTLPYAEYNVDTLVRGMKTRYRCPFCYREYLDNDNATSCLARCKKHIFSETGSDPYLEASKRDLALVKGGKVLAAVSSAPRRETALSGRSDRVSSSTNSSNSGGSSEFLDNHENKSAAKASSAPAKAAKAEAAPEKKEEKPKEKYDPNVIYREPGQKPFSRADARYCCGACNTKYFTKTEVEQCFNSHPLKPDV